MERIDHLVQTIRDAATELASADLSHVPLPDLGPLLQRVESTHAIVDAAADHVLDRFDTEGGSVHDGLRTTRAWLTQHAQVTGATASRRIRSVRALRHLPAVSERYRTGRFSADQVDRFARCRNPRTADALVQDESALVALAESLRVDDFARELRGWAELVDTDGAEPDPGHRDRGFSLTQTLDDAWTGRIDLGAADGALLDAAVTAMAEALYRREATDRDPDGVRRTPSQRRADALLELVRKGSRRVDATSATGGIGASLHLVLDAADLEAGRGADTLDRRHLTPSGTDRLVCDGALNSVLRDGASGAVLEFGRSRRVVSSAQRAALAVRDGGCSYPGCDAPPQDCDAHHVVHWRNGGRTDLANLALACWSTHHPLAHEGRWSMVADPHGGSPTWVRPDGTPVDPTPGWGSADRSAAGRDPCGPPSPPDVLAGEAPAPDEQELVAMARSRAFQLRAA